MIDKIKEELVDLAGIDDEDDFEFSEISIQDLAKYSTTCGIANNKCFTKEAILKLKEMKIEKVYVIIMDSEIVSMAINVDYDKNIKKLDSFSNIIQSNKGSLRHDDSKYVGWTVFESE